jgi:hypothetical protein
MTHDPAPRSAETPAVVGDPALSALDRELSAIQFRERASFEAELRVSLRRARRSRERLSLSAALAAAAVLLLAPTQLTDGPGKPGAADVATRPVFIVDENGATGLYLVIAGDGRVLRVGAGQPGEAPATPRTAGAGNVFACHFDAREGRCGPGASVTASPASPRLANGPFAYRDICCDIREPGHGGEGVLTVSGLREPALFVFVYEDVNDDGRLSAGDRLRARVHPSGGGPDDAHYAFGSRSGRISGRTSASPARPMAAVVY